MQEAHFLKFLPAELGPLQSLQQHPVVPTTLLISVEVGQEKFIFPLMRFETCKQ